MQEPVLESEQQLTDWLSRITFKNTVLDFKWKFEYKTISVEPGIGWNQSRDGFLLWVSFDRPDTLSGTIGRGRGRDEIVWMGTSLSGVVKTAWLLVELMVRHELMEGFNFDGHKIFNPHNSVSDLAVLQTLHDLKVDEHTTDWKNGPSG